MKRDRDVYSFLRTSLIGLRSKLVFLSVARTVVSSSLVLSSLCMRNLIDAAVNGSLHVFRRNAGFLFFLFVTLELAKAYAGICGEELKSSLENRIKDRLICSFLWGDYGKITKKHSEEWMSLFTSDAGIVANTLTSILPESISILVRMVLISAIMTNIFPELMLILFPTGIIMAFISLSLRRRMKTQYKEIQEADQELRVEVSERLRNIMVIRAYSKEENSGHAIKKDMEWHKEKRIEKAHYSAKMSALLGAVMRGASFLGTVGGGARMLIGSLSYGSFYAVLQLITLVRYPATEISNIVPEYYALLSSTERIMKAIEQAGVEEERYILGADEAKKYYDKEFLSIDLKNVSFAYDDLDNKKTFTGVSFSISKGEFVGIRGASGLGKTTIMKLLLCLYFPLSGEIILNGKKEEIVLSQAYRSLFAYVPQGNALLTGTLREVISFWDPNPEEERIMFAAKITGLSDLIEALPKKLDTYIEEGGNNFSEGQKQRIAIARAVYSERPILLLDEVTSALDSKVERQVLENLRNLTDKTVVIITHKKDVFSMCDKGLTLNETGTVEEFLNND